MNEKSKARRNLRNGAYKAARKDHGPYIPKHQVKRLVFEQVRKQIKTGVLSAEGLDFDGRKSKTKTATSERTT